MDEREHRAVTELLFDLLQSSVAGKRCPANRGELLQALLLAACEQEGQGRRAAGKQLRDLAARVEIDVVSPRTSARRTCR